MSKNSSVSEFKFRIRHTGLPVADLDRTIDFYTRLLGMDIMRLRNAPEQNLRAAYLGYGCEDEGPGLEMIEHGGPDKNKQMPTWAGHMAILPSDIYKLCEILKKEGVCITDEPRPNRPGSKDHVGWIKDPDGYSIELTERHTLTGPPVKQT